MSAAATGSGITESKQYKPIVFTDAFTVNYTIDADDVPRGDVRPQPERPGGLRAGAGRHGPDLLHGAVPEGALSNRNAAGVGQIADALPERAGAEHELLRVHGAVRP